MPRYIDADKLIELATHEGAYGYVDIHDIYNTPTADVVEVVRCKDCRYECGDACLHALGLARLNRPNAIAHMVNERRKPMPDTMSFPKTLDEFMEQYKIVDTEQVYTNGVELVPIFRIRQWEDAHKPKKGKWIRSGEGSYEVYECSSCGNPWYEWWASAGDSDWMSKKLKYCPNCGADMREVKPDE